MEDGESENIFDSLNLNPQLFLNEVLNTVDDVVDEGFEFFEQQALERVGGTSEEEDDRLRKGVSSVHNMIQEASVKRLTMWEKYCLQHCFTVPKGISLPKADTSGDDLMDTDAVAAELDDPLDSLREKLFVVGKENDELQRTLHAMKKQSMHHSCVESAREALKQFDQTSVQDMFQGMVKAAAELRARLEKRMNKRMVERERITTEKIYNLNKDQTLVHHINGLSEDDLCDLQEHLAEV